MKRITLRLQTKERRCEIWVGDQVLSKLSSYLNKRRPSKIILIADQRLRVATQILSESLTRFGIAHSLLRVPAGESLKSLEAASKIFGELIKRKIDRKAVLLALGGGSVGDAVGFVAATYLRGIDWVSLPTTLLAQVDSSVGGKTGINHPEGKNLIGSFHQPAMVICELSFLETLGTREIVSGLGEMLKYGIAQDEKFYAQTLQAIPQLLARDAASLRRGIVKSLEIKAKAVERDERDLLGVREVLNFGHTFGHALESLTSYKKYQHGEAVIWGMRYALALSQVRGHLREDDYQKILTGLRALPVPALPKTIKPAQYIEAMSKDKKSEAGRVRFVLLSGLGRTLADPNSSPLELKQAYARMILDTGTAP